MAIETVNPIQGPATGGTLVTVTGHDFLALNGAVTLQESAGSGWRAATGVKILSDFTMSFITPVWDLAPGDVDLYLWRTDSTVDYRAHGFTFVAVPVIPPPPVSSRKAWLVLGGMTMPLDDSDAGYAMTELDLSYPDIRDVTNNRPNQHGLDDRTLFFGGRVITAKITAWPGSNVALDDIADKFAAYLNPSVRPELHYTTDSNTELERVLILRASALASPMDPPFKRDIQLSWVAPDPIVRDAVKQTQTAMSGSSTSPGRNYNLTFPRLYPPGGGSPVNAIFQTNGDLPVSPLLRLYGPITAAQIATQATSGPTIYNGLIAFDQAFVVGSGQHVDIDCLNHTVLLNGDPTQSLQSHVLFTPTVWPLIWPKPFTNVLSLTGQSTAGVTQVQAIWQDGYIQ